MSTFMVELATGGGVLLVCLFSLIVCFVVKATASLVRDFTSYIKEKRELDD